MEESEVEFIEFPDGTLLKARVGEPIAARPENDAVLAEVLKLNFFWRDLRGFTVAQDADGLWVTRRFTPGFFDEDDDRGEYEAEAERAAETVRAMIGMVDVSLAAGEAAETSEMEQEVAV